LAKSVVFDLGGVLVDWDPRYLLREVMAGREDEMEWLLADVLNREWNLARDGGDSWSDAMAALVERHPEYEDVFRVYDERWPEMLGGDRPDTVAVLAELRDADVPLFALTNWSAEKFPHAEERFEWLDWFDGIIVSGRVRIAKPDPAIYQLLLETFGLEPAETFFTDDHEPNVVAARTLGIEAHLFTTAATLRRDLVAAGYLPG
jgi:2-haloacid dehalogenase